MNINILLLVILAFVIVKVIDGYKKGMVKEIISFVSLIIMCIVVVLLGACLQNYTEKEYVGLIIAVILLILLGIAHHILKLFFFSAKLISKLPIIHSCDKLLGMVAGALEVLLVLLTVYTFTLYCDMGAIEEFVLKYTNESQILSWLYNNNMLAKIVEKVLTKSLL